MIWIAIVIEGAVMDFPDFLLLLFLQFVNGFVGWNEERHAGDAIAALKENLAPRATVKRDGVWDSIPSAEVVVGDRVRVEIGDILPADLIIDSGRAEIDQSSLTGESIPVTKKADDQALQGTICKKGRFEGIVFATGVNTFLGKTTELIASVDGIGHFQQVLLSTTWFLSILSFSFTLVIFAVIMIKGAGFMGAMSICAVIIVASIPIAMQVICTTTLAIGSRALAEKKAIVSRLTAIEELAGMQILCIDKTGTLTENKLTVQSVVPEIGISEAFFVQSLGLACHREEASHDPIDTALAKYIEEKFPETRYDEFELVEFVDFDPERKRAEGIYTEKASGKTIIFTKGAPQKILDLCNLPPMPRQKWKDEIVSQAKKGYRTLAVAKQVDQGPWELIGLIPLHDPPRPDTKRTLDKAAAMGIRVKMVTGDQLAIARETGRVLGMTGEFYTFEELSQMPDNIDEVMESASGFAEVFPQHKFEIVERLQKLGYRVGMTGDGVNDAPALKKADVGVAVDGATDAARASADIVLTKPGLSVIINSIYTSRQIFQRIKNYCIYRIACTLQLLFFFVVSMVIYDPDLFDCDGHDDCDDVPKYFTFPVFAIVLIAVLNDGTLVSIAVDNALVSKRPDAWNLPLLYASSLTLGFVSLVSSITLLTLFLTHMNENDPNPIMHLFRIDPLSYPEVITGLFLKVAVSDFITVFAARTESYFFTHRPSAIVMICAIFATACSTLLSLFWYLNFESTSEEKKHKMQSIRWPVVLFVWVYNIIWFLIQDVTKVWTYKAFDAYQRRSGKTHLRDPNEDIIHVSFTQSSFAKSDVSAPEPEAAHLLGTTTA